MSFYKLENTETLKSLLVISSLSPMATKHSKLWLKLKWRNRQQISH